VKLTTHRNLVPSLRGAELYLHFSNTYSRRGAYLGKRYVFMWLYSVTHRG